ncbi:hypothetical protein [Sphingomonas sp. LM7]|uniref:hypothetical protein n=1 Tax=Sphingomonas sp. LM7 TaxID=1938607 RepID=UPI00098403E0|nr:hypothetical protein [Sphingomonas sp. LM7]AQR73428.1 hypothetical protein BXU08_07040 [Sphingomonas sp. LM7]
MRMMKMMMQGAGIAALLTATPSLAQSRIDRARTAVAEATAKVEAAERAGATTHASDTMARAQESLRVARDQLARDHRDSTINEARRASALADQALDQAESNKTAQASNEREQRLAAEAAASAAAQDAAAEREQRAAAENAAVQAQNQAAAASQQAATAQQAATLAAAEAAAARESSTTITTTTSAPAARSYSSKKTTVKRTTRKPGTAAAPRTTTTTTVETKANN